MRICLRRYKYCPFCATQFDFAPVVYQKCVQCKWVYYPHTPLTAATFVVVEKKILLVKRKASPFKNYWTMPAGFIEYGENPIDGALRELKEETNLSADFKSIVGMYIIDDHPEIFSLLTIISVHNLNGHLTPRDDSVDARFFEKNNLPPIAFRVHKKVIDMFL